MSELFSDFRLRYGFQKLRRELKKISRKNQSVSLDDAQNIGVLVSIQNEKEMQEAELFASELQKTHQKVKLLGFILDKTLNLSGSKNIELLTRADVNWNYVPKKEKIKNFVDNEFDILLNLCTELCFPLLYITALSKSLFKVGAYDKKNAALFDFMLATEQHNITGFSAELEHYLEKIK